MVDEMLNFMASGGIITNPIILRQESYRILTFASWPQSSKIFPSLLASAGFYYAGRGEEAICFSCNGHIHIWPLEHTPMELHKIKFPNCLFVRGIDNNNVAIQGYMPGDDARTSLDYRQASEPVSQPQSLPFSGNNNYPTGLNVFQSLQPYAPREPSPSIPDSRVSGHTREVPQLSQSEQPLDFNFTSRSTESRPSWDENVTRPLTSYNDKKTERGRLATFIGWPLTANVTPADLARAGFFYTGVGDNVECAYCGGGLCNWEPGDQPMVEHRENFPSCRFIQEHDRNASNTISSTAAVVQPHAAPAGRESENWDEMGVIDAVQHQYPSYAVLASRLNSYARWDPTHHLRPDELSHAGFYYTGDLDNVLCFSCGGGLRNWEEGDDPWAEHARWFPRCSFLRQVKGRQFIEEIRQRYAHEQEVPAVTDVPVGVSEEPIIPPSSTTAAPTTIGVSRATGTIAPGRDDPIKKMIENVHVESVRSMGFEEDRIKAVLRRNMTNWGGKVPSLEVLLDAIFQENGDSDESADMEYTPSSSPETVQSTTKKTSSTTDYEKKPSAAAAATIHEDSEPELTNIEKLKRDILEEKKKKAELEKQEKVIDEATNALQKEIDELRERNKCKICMDEEIAIVFLPCGHLVACATCAAALKKCPLCRTIIKGTVHTYLA